MNRPIPRATAAVAAGVAAAVLALRGRTRRAEPLAAVVGAWSGIASGLGGRRVEVALVLGLRGGGLIRKPSLDLALRTREDVGKAPLERSTREDDLLRRGSLVARPGELAIETRGRVRIVHDAARPDEVRVTARGYWRELDLDVVLARAAEASS